MSIEKLNKILHEIYLKAAICKVIVPGTVEITLPDGFKTTAKGISVADATNKAAKKILKSNFSNYKPIND